MRSVLRLVAALEVLGAAAFTIATIAVLPFPKVAWPILPISVPLAALNAYGGVQLWRLRKRGRLVSIGILTLYLVASIAALVLASELRVGAALWSVALVIMLLSLVSRRAANGCRAV